MQRYEPVRHRARHRGRGLLLRSATGDGGKVNGVPDGTVLRDSIVQTFGSGSSVDAANGDFRPLADSPTVDAGSTDPLLGFSDPAGCARTLGGSADIGAYEYANPALDGCAWAPPEPVLSEPARPSTGDVEVDLAIRGVPLPVLGRTVVVSPGLGHVLGRRPGSPRFRTLDGAERLPVGSIVDARDGHVELVTSIATDGRLQSGKFWGSKLEVRQPRDGRGMTSLILRGGNFASCRRGSGSRMAGASAVRRIRRLWGRDRGGRFRTYGRQSQATVRGTRWLTEDRCDGTLTRVTSGAVAGARPRAAQDGDRPRRALPPRSRTAIEVTSSHRERLRAHSLAAAG